MPNSPADVAAGAPNVQSYTDNADGTVTDKVTGLMWQQGVSQTLLDVPQGIAFCSTLGLAGHPGWRLPTFVELMSLMDAGRATAPYINTTYFPTPSDIFWTATAVVGSQRQNLDVNFGDASTNVGSNDTPANVRCVR